MGPTARGSADHVELHVGNRIRRLREHLEISEEALASALDLSVRQLRNYERGANQISVRTLFRISRRLNVSIEYFFQGLTAAND